MSRGAQASAQVEDTEQLDLTVRELRARYLRQLRRERGRQTLRLLRHRRQRAIERRRANGLQVRQRGGRGRGRGQNVGRVLQQLARKFKGRGAIDVRQLAKRFRGNPRLQALARRVKGRRLNVGLLARLFNRRRGGRGGRGRRPQQQVGRRPRRQQARRGRRQPLSLRKIAQRFPRSQGGYSSTGHLVCTPPGPTSWYRRSCARQPPACPSVPSLESQPARTPVPSQSRLAQLGQSSHPATQATPWARSAVQARANRRGRSNRGGLMTLFRRLQRGGKGKVNLQQLARRFRTNPRLQGLVRKFRRNPNALRRLAQRFTNAQRRRPGRVRRRRSGSRQGLVGLQSLARRFRGNRQLQSLARRFPRGRINLGQLARRFPRNRRLQQLARKLRSAQSKRAPRRAPAVRRRQGPMARSLINYADDWFKDIHRFNKQQQAKRMQGPMFNAHVVPVNGRNSERALGELAEMAYARGWLSSGRSGKQSFFDERRASGSRVGGIADSLVRRQGAGDVEVGQRRDFSVDDEAAGSFEAPLSSRGGRPSALGEGIIDFDRWRNTGKTTQEIMRESATRFDRDLREPEGPKDPLDEDEDMDQSKAKVSRRRLGEQSSRGRGRRSVVPTRPVNCDRAALRPTLPPSKLFRVKLKNYPGLIPCRCVRRGSVAAVRSLRNVAKQLCPARVVPSHSLMRNLAAFALPRVPAQAGLSLRPFGSGGHPMAVLQRRASIKEDQLKSFPTSRVHRFGFQSKSVIPLESRVIMARLRLRVQAKDNLPGVCTVKDAAMAVKVGGKLGQVLTLIGRVPEATEALVQGRKVTIEAIVRYHEKECLDMTRFEVKGSREGAEEA
ncbi:hypothetical protein BCR44DRAFT_1433015 [Catenaria anguillulae PL171]|uniref:Uncharacterized protein n=1 Tax=Catenaria anguillulae PL171 TaxID=765915 RepID=A0A1Y2HNQ5_9FUNG|nr:hypothetical protein BCR44DRAFT_1433015 [Catenaria anguillulae PL171]